MNPRPPRSLPSAPAPWLALALLAALAAGCEQDTPAGSAPAAPQPAAPEPGPPTSRPEPAAADPANRAPPLPPPPAPDPRLGDVAAEVNALAEALVTAAWGGGSPRFPDLEEVELLGDEAPAALGDAPRIVLTQLGLEAVAPDEVGLRARCWVFPDGRVVFGSLELRPGGRAPPSRGLAEAAPVLERLPRWLAQAVRNEADVPLIGEEHLLPLPELMRRDMTQGAADLPPLEALRAADGFQARVTDLDVMVYGEGVYGLLRAGLRVRRGRLVLLSPKFGVMAY